MADSLIQSWGHGLYHTPQDKELEGSGILEKMAMDRLLDGLMLQAWQAIYVKAGTKFYVHSRGKQFIRWSILPEPYGVATDSTSLAVSNFVVGRKPGFYDFAFGMRRTKRSANMVWFRKRNANYNVFDPFLRFWLRRGGKQLPDSYYLNEKKNT